MRLHDVGAQVSPVLEVAATEAPLRRDGVRLRRPLLLLLLASVVILALGAIENQYGNTDAGDVYGSDAVQYLDIARAMERGNWHSALNPLWSQGYPAILAAVRPIFAAGPGGDWTSVRVVNFGIFAANYFAFLYLLIGLVERFDESSAGMRRRSLFLWIAGLSVFLATQICMGQVSRVNPDELVTTLFFVACGLIVRMLYRQNRPEGLAGLGLLLGGVLGAGFLVKAVFLALGCGMLVIAGIALWRKRRVVAPTLVAAMVFAVVVGSYGVALSRAAGYRTLGEAGSINYAWHVDRLQKWVHWEGGVEPASEAWPSARIAKFAQWDAHPPDFGEPLHPSVVLQREPLVYGFAAPFHATYAPYYNPPYWYEGRRHVVRWRYQVIAIGKSLGDLAHALLVQPMFFAVVLALVMLLREWGARRRFARWARGHWAILACGCVAVAIYVPVHLEGRYLAGFLAMLAMCGLIAATSAEEGLSGSQLRVVSLAVLLGLVGDLAMYQAPVWRNMLHHKSPQDNVEWKMGEAVLAEGLPPMSQVGVIAWTANLHSDWAYMANVQITTEIQSGTDFDRFWRMAEENQSQTLETFRRAGTVAVFVDGKPPGLGGPGWKQLAGTPMWMYRF